jgi:hypothetical protein
MTDVRERSDTTTTSDIAVSQLAAQFRGELVRPGDAGYDHARTIFNSMIDRRPGLIARCAGTDDVAAAVDFGRERGMLVSIRGGGHNVAGNAVCDGGLVIDLSRMKQIEVDPDARTVRAEGGVTWGELDQATQAHALATTGGVVSTTGIAGLTLGGGIGLLARRFGLASDNLLSVEIVTADGQLRTASATEHPDLFWAVRGGGGNFGVVTSLTYQLHPVGPTVLGGIIIHAFDRAHDVFRFYRDEIVGAPDELTVYPGMLTGPEGDPLVALVVCYSGPLDQAERIVAPLRNFGPPVADLLTEMPYTAVQQLFDAAYPSGRRNYWKSNFTDALSNEAIDTAISWFQKVPSPWSTAALEHLGGAVSRLDRDATAFNQRDAQHTWTIASGWADPAEDEVNIQWTRDFWQAMQPFTRPSVYVNYLQADEHDRIRAAYGDKYDRLAAIKATYDPSNLFRMNQNIEPAN